MRALNKTRMKTKLQSLLSKLFSPPAIAPSAAVLSESATLAGIPPGRVVPAMLALGAAAILFTGCAMPVPGTRIKGQIGGVPFEVHSPKQATLKGLMIQHSAGTNHFVLNVAELSSTNDPQVIDKSYAGQAAVAKAHYDGATALVEKAVEAGVKAGAKTVVP